MSIAKYNEQKKAEKEAAAKLAAVKAEPKQEVENAQESTSTAAPIPETGTTEETADQMAANLSGETFETVVVTGDPNPNKGNKGDEEEEAEEAELSDWISPYDINYKELETILDGEELSDYIGDRLPEEEVKLIEKDYKLYLKNK